MSRLLFHQIVTELTTELIEDTEPANENSDNRTKMMRCLTEAYTIATDEDIEELGEYLVMQHEIIYDNKGRWVEDNDLHKEHPSSNQRSYDEQGNVLWQQECDGEENILLNVEYTYDVEGRVVQKVVEKYQLKLHEYPITIERYSYSSAGYLSRVERVVGDETSEKIIELQLYCYDPDGGTIGKFIYNHEELIDVEVIQVETLENGESSASYVNYADVFKLRYEDTEPTLEGMTPLLETLDYKQYTVTLYDAELRLIEINYYEGIYADDRQEHINQPEKIVRFNQQGYLIIITHEDQKWNVYKEKKNDFNDVVWSILTAYQTLSEAEEEINGEVIEEVRYDLTYDAHNRWIRQVKFQWSADDNRFIPDCLECRTITYYQ